jgi:nitrous oxidase accessory protein NosD
VKDGAVEFERGKSMKMRNFILLIMATAFLTLTLAVPAFATSQMQVVVDDDKVECPNAGFTHIQDAVNAASPGASIRICKGTYAEQVTINKPLEVHADSGAIVMPSTMQQNSTSLFDAAPLAVAFW